MNYLKNFKEGNSNDLSFGEFKEIMNGLIDDYDYEYEFEKYKPNPNLRVFNGKPPENYYKCYISSSTNLKFQDYSFEYMSESKEINYENINIDSNYNVIKDHIQELETFKEKIEKVIKMNTDLKKILDDLKKYEKFSCHIVIIKS